MCLVNNACCLVMHVHACHILKPCHPPWSSCPCHVFKPSNAIIFKALGYAPSYHQESVLGVMSFYYFMHFNLPIKPQGHHIIIRVCPQATWVIMPLYMH